MGEPFLAWLGTGLGGGWVLEDPSRMPHQEDKELEEPKTCQSS